VNTRAASYLQLLMSNPGTWVHIRKSKSKEISVNSRQISAERREVYGDILTSLRIMGIAHDVAGSGAYRILIKHM